MKKRYIILVFLSVIILWAINWVGIKMDYVDRGTLGDMFGVVNSLFSGLAFAGLVVTIIIQQIQISDNRRDTEEIRKLQAAQVKALETSCKISKLTKMLELHSSIVFEQQRKLSDGGRNFDHQIAQEIDESKAKMKELYAELQKL